uniref:Transglutaminase n=1 Tax=uncultured bacterium 12-5D TaxID=1497524 RepID=A0A059U0E5_9BACT|nr:transglutaminase [uncultured bacterium 12-5D]
MLSASIVDIFDYLQPTSTVEISPTSMQWAKRYLRDGLPLGRALEQLNAEIYSFFTYKPGATDHFTPLKELWKQRVGVCQDYAHLMLSVLRAARIPCRYVCGYIESTPPSDKGSRGRKLVGSIATHAWVEVLVPGSRWAAYDPTNNCLCGEQHIAVSYGRDAQEAAPLRGTFKGSGGQKMNVRVMVKRLPENAKPERADSRSGVGS